MCSKKTDLRGSLALTVGLMFLAVSGQAVAVSTCNPVNGHLEEHFVSGGAILNTEGSVIGGLQGKYFFSATGLMPTGVGAVHTFTGDSRIETKKGNLNFLEAGGFDLATTATDPPPGKFASLWTFTGGTGDFVGATGHVTASGFFTEGAGSAEYSGVVCLP